MALLHKPIQTMRAWVRRREDQHKPWNADELWERIRRNWPKMEPADMETVFQETARGVTRRGEFSGCKESAR